MGQQVFESGTQYLAQIGAGIGQDRHELTYLREKPLQKSLLSEGSSCPRISLPLRSRLEAVTATVKPWLADTAARLQLEAESSSTIKATGLGDIWYGRFSQGPRKYLIQAYYSAIAAFSGCCDKI